MREIGKLEDRDQAVKFVAYLLSEKIDSEWRETGAGNFSVWVHDDDQLFKAKSLLMDFREDPDNERYFALDKLKEIVKQRSEQDKGRGRFVDVRTEVFSRPGGGATATLIFLGLSVVLTLIFWSARNNPVVYKLFYSEIVRGPQFYEILNGQIWRLVTPIFLHDGILHLGFNMLWLYQLGKQIEINKSGKFLTLQVLIIAVLCNTSQYLVSGPAFLGFSGVVYGQLGYVWMMSRYDHQSRFEMHPQTVGIMVIWLVICWVGIIPNVANTQHIVGFASGILWGFIASGGLKQEIRRQKFKSQYRDR